MASNNRNFGHLLESLVYVGLLLFFTYTFLAVECLKDVDKLYDAYVQNQASIFALLTNFGLYFLLLIDYQSGRNKQPSWVVWSMALLIMVDILIYGDAKVLANKEGYADFKLLLEYPKALILLHSATVPLLVFIKYKSLEEITVKEKI